MEATMETKLTLKMNQSVICQAKKYAEDNHKSLSRIVEDFFRSLSHKSGMPQNYPPLIEQLTGVISEDDLRKLSAKDEKARYILGDEK
jgi:hypothetical protein